ncbi:MAG: thioesterase [Bacteroidetes bacterium RIFOXYA12_FULL_35_11]|nr:MAG: thioesterase [Bacteroidetes bacterium GWF2_35_48]OFY72655.1 MAG: thioesterase [Bacteroidetes bacterium RIFOXYA12_FULL_35_11]OFY96178.1 MAG: thioesterase [Bacteroidetes bacterium RIFOXYB2_FULL_35_7]OFY98196.1 MAG: thioesterase [Bacteroidetes bacterium RIFOXYC12_FULL_35_7]HBX50163.1 thioesterase [Bacteroidales bacterium]
MKKIFNPYKNIKDYFCFGCSPDNQNGLQMDFYEDGDFIICNWKPKHHLQGYVNVLHGGIQATLLDEIASWVVNIKLKTAGVTYNMDINLKKPLYLNKAPYHIRAALIEQKRKVAIIHAELFDADKTLCTEGKIQYYVFPEAYAKDTLLYPGLETFFEK